MMNPQIQMPAGLSISTAAQKKRVPRRPRHNFNLVQYPYEITPFLIAPVLPGETLQNALMQCRTVSTGLNNSLIGHHLEHYFFYVKFTQLADKDALQAMVLNSNSDPGLTTASADSVYLDVKSGAPNFVEQCLDVVVKEYFRDEKDTGSYVGSVTGLPMAQWSAVNHSVFNSLIDDDAGDLIIGDTTDAEFKDFEVAYNNWLYMRETRMTDLTWEQFLASYGVRLPDAEKEDVPELLRMTKNWSYPTNTVDGNGNVNTQMSWSLTERIDKARFFLQPGFIFGVTVARPKVNLNAQQQSSVSLLGNAFAWLPALMKDHPETSLRKIDVSVDAAISPVALAATGDAHSDTQDFWVDIRDLYLYGDRFINHAGDANHVNASSWNTVYGKKYPSSADLQSLGVTSLTYASDGVVSFNIMGTQIDMT